MVKVFEGEAIPVETDEPGNSKSTDLYVGENPAPSFFTDQRILYLRDLIIELEKSGKPTGLELTVRGATYLVAPLDKREGNYLISGSGTVVEVPTFAQLQAVAEHLFPNRYPYRTLVHGNPIHGYIVSKEEDTFDHDTRLQKVADISAPLLFPHSRIDIVMKKGKYDLD